LLVVVAAAAGIGLPDDDVAAAGLKAKSLKVRSTESSGTPT
jgi:hypothetical protein